MTNSGSQRALNALSRLCSSGLDSWALRTRALQYVQTLVPFDCAWWATADPATLLFTGGLSQDIPGDATPLFVDNELLEDDLNKFSELATQACPVGTLYAATRGSPQRSSRYRKILHPFGMGDELRAALVEGGMCWGYICLHRAGTATPFTLEDMTQMQGVGPRLAAGMRNALLLDLQRSRAGAEPPGVVTLSRDLSLVSVTPNAAAWLDEMADSPSGPAPAQAIAGVAAQLLAQERGESSVAAATPRVRVRTRAGRWLTLHALRLSDGARSGEIAVVLEPARPEEMAPLLLSAYGLTERERTVAQCVLRGMSNKTIGRRLSISPLTVQQHLKGIFEKVGIHSRGELMARVLAEFRWDASHAPRDA
jgi:DNA-binding CsgD family transcriptional regulator